MQLAEFSRWCLTFKLTCTLGWADFGLGFRAQNWTAAKCQVERMVRPAVTLPGELVIEKKNNAPGRWILKLRSGKAVEKQQASCAASGVCVLPGRAG